MPYEYLLKSISHDFSGGTSSWTMIRFYDYYIPEDGDHYTWQIVSAYNWTQMYQMFTWQEVYEN